MTVSASRFIAGGAEPETRKATQQPAPSKTTSKDIKGKPTAAPAVKKTRKRAEEVEFYESIDLHGETYSLGDDGEIDPCACASAPMLPAFLAPYHLLLFHLPLSLPFYPFSLPDRDRGSVPAA